jgi:hypothetical protein
MKPPDELLNWAANSAKKRGLRPTMLALASWIAKARGMGFQTHAALAGDKGLAGIGLEPDATAPVDWIGQVYETLLAAKTRRARGVHFTPPEVAAGVAEATLGPLKGPLRIIDPAMGCGAFLLAAVRFCRGAACCAPTFTGFDTDPLAVELARLSLSIETGLPVTEFANLRVGDALLEAGGEFDAVIGNPPFGNAIEKRTSRSASYSAKMRESFPEFTKGAYDTSLLFFALATRLLAPHGRYGLIGPTALLSDAKPWQQFMHEHFRPRALFLYPVNCFGAARIRTTAFIGARGTCENVEVRDFDERATHGSPLRAAWQTGTWYETVQGAPRIEATHVLGDFADVFAGCATGAAYELAPLVRNARLGQRLITTGALDRFRCKWGDAPIRFLGRDFARPVWPKKGPLWPKKGPRAVMAALARQQRPKILVGGLTSVIEAWFDETGCAAGVVSTWVIVPKAGVDAWALLALLNCATLSRIYMARHGARSMSGRQTTIYKQALLELPMPDLRAQHLSDEALAKSDGSPLQSARELQGLPLGPRFDAVDRELHLVASKMLGRSDAEATDDYAWWHERAAKGGYSPST